ncbi:hypothetical protein TNCV_902391 [Trichonephila clavipes]|nr:hypothetical protein TNCV_902391 [Trichonephila clavipes]
MTPHRSLSYNGASVDFIHPRDPHRESWTNPNQSSSITDPAHMDNKDTTNIQDIGPQVSTLHLITDECHFIKQLTCLFLARLRFYNHQPELEKPGRGRD